jgi:hypothetical protein
LSRRRASRHTLLLLLFLLLMLLRAVRRGAHQRTTTPAPRNRAVCVLIPPLVVAGTSHGEVPGRLLSARARARARHGSARGRMARGGHDGAVVHTRMARSGGCFYKSS